MGFLHFLTRSSIKLNYFRNLCKKMTLMCVYFKILINDFFLILTVGGPFHWKDFKWEKQGGTGLISEKWKFFQQNLIEERKQSLMVTPNQRFLRCIYSVLAAKNHQIRCFAHKFFFHRYFSTMLIMVTEQLLWRKFFTTVASYCYYEKMRRTMRTLIVSYLLNSSTHSWD